MSFDKFGINEFIMVNAQTQLMEAAKQLAYKYKIKSFYCGFEPASDMATRLFTGDKLGPLMKL